MSLYHFFKFVNRLRFISKNFLVLIELPFKSFIIVPEVLDEVFILMEAIVRCELENNTRFGVLFALSLGHRRWYRCARLALRELQGLSKALSLKSSFEVLSRFGTIGINLEVA